MSSGTTNTEAQENCVLADSILGNIQYGTYKVPGHGVVTLDRKRAKSFIGNKLSHLRKPSAYKRKSMVKSTSKDLYKCTLYTVIAYTSIDYSEVCV